MSKSTYGCIAFKFKHPDNATDEQIVHVVQVNMRLIEAIIKDLDGELTTLEEVMKAKNSDNPRIGEASVRDTINGKWPREGHGGK